MPPNASERLQDAEDTVRHRLSRNLRIARLEDGLSQRELAERVGVHKNQIQRYEYDNEYPPSVAALMLLAQELTRSADWLLFNTDFSVLDDDEVYGDDGE